MLKIGLDVTPSGCLSTILGLRNEAARAANIMGKPGNETRKIGAIVTHLLHS